VARAEPLLAAVTFLCVSGGLMVAMGAHEESGRAAAQGVRSESVRWSSGERPAPSFSLRDQDGRQVSLGAPRRQSAVVTFMSSRCAEECPRVLGRLLGETWRGLRPSERPQLIVVSVDPWRDSPTSARVFMRRTRWPGEWSWLMGDEQSLRRVWMAYGIDVTRTPTDVEHTALTYLVDRDGYERAAYPVPFDPDDLAADVRKLARA
jgi:protein SCO1